MENETIDKNRWEWAQTIAEGIPPSARGGHTATLIGKSIVIFGGHYYSDKNIGFVYLNDTYFLDVAMSKWIKPYCTGKIPPPRYGHTAVYAGGIIIIFGGKGPKNSVYNDLYTFNPDPDNYTWLLANETGEAPAPRFNHSANLWSIFVLIKIKRSIYSAVGMEKIISMMLLPLILKRWYGVN
jgi:host cell factor